MPALVTSLAGALGIPHNDDWSYRRTAVNFYHTGHLDDYGWAAKTLVGQIYFARPFLWAAHGGTWAFAASTAVLATIGISSIYLLLLRILGRRASLWALLSLLAVPGFPRNTVTFMTDVPGWAAEAACLALGMVALRSDPRSRLPWLCVSLLVGVLAFTIREFALAAPVAVLAAATAADRRHWPQHCALGAAVGLLCGLTYLWTSSVVGNTSAALHVPSEPSLAQVARAITTLALTLLPALLLAARDWHGDGLHRFRLVGCLGAFVLVLVPVVGGLRHHTSPEFFVGNMLSRQGEIGNPLLGTRPALFPGAVWVGLEAAAVLATVLGGGALGHLVGATTRTRPRHPGRRDAQCLGSPTGLLATFCVLYSMGVATYGLVLGRVIDRYLWPLVVPLVALLMTQGHSAVPPGARKAVERIRDGVFAMAGRLTLAGLGAVSLATMLNSAAFDAGRWQAGTLAVREGVDARAVDAGFEWVGYHATGSARPGRIGKRGESWWGSMFASFDPCAIVSASNVGHTHVVAVVTYKLLQIAGPEEPLYVLSNRGTARRCR